MDRLNVENEGLEFFETVPNDLNLDSIKNESFDELLSIQEPYWLPIFPEYSIFRFMNVDESIISLHENPLNLLWYRPIILINGYQSNRMTWNKFAQQLWNSGFRNIFALEPESFTNNLDNEYQKFDLAISTILSFLSLFNSVILIGHSLGGTLARYYVKRNENLNNCNVSLLITLGTPHYGFSKYFKYVEPFFRLIINTETLDLFSKENGIKTINKIYQKNELHVTMINIQGSMKRLGGGDGTFKPEPVSEMINYVVHRHHFRINKSLHVFNLLRDYLCNEAQIFKIQLNYIDFSASLLINPIFVFFVIKINEEIEQRFPIQDEIEISSNSVFSRNPVTVFAGKFDPFSPIQKIRIALFRKKKLVSEKILEGEFAIQSTSEEPIVDYHNIHNQIVSLNFNSLSYKIGKEIFTKF